jgi:AcrR family transcriptional regulator
MLGSMATADVGPRLSKRGRRERTRDQLLGAAIELLRFEGLGAVSVSRMARRIGVHHSLFYAHFKDTDSCLAATAQHVLASLGPIDRELRRELLRRAVAHRPEVARYFEGALARWMEQRPFVELLLAHRLDRSVIGETLRTALAGMRSEFASELWELAVQMKVSGNRMHEVSALADLHLSHWLWALELLIEEREHDQKVLAARLADMFIATNMTFFQRATRPNHEQLVAATFTPERVHALRTARDAFRALLAAHDDAELIALAGGASTLIEQALIGLCAHFMPGAAPNASASVCYRVECTGERIVRGFAVRDGRCTLLTECDESNARLIVSCSLRTLLETIARTRTFDAAYREGKMQVEGDLFFAVEMLDWFLEHE